MFDEICTSPLPRQAGTALYPGLHVYAAQREKGADGLFCAPILLQMTGFTNTPLSSIKRVISRMMNVSPITIGYCSLRAFDIKFAFFELGVE